MSEAFDFSVTSDIYANGFSIRQAYLKAGYDVESSQERARIEEAFVATATKASYKQQLQDYCKLKMEYKESSAYIFCNGDLSSNPRLIEIQNRLSSLERSNQTFKESYEVLGANRIETMRYSKKAINQAVFEESNEVREVIKHSVFTKFNNEGFYSSNNIIEVLQEVYDRHKIKKKAKSVDILNFLPAASTVKKIDGKPVKGYEIKLVKNSYIY